VHDGAAAGGGKDPGAVCRRAEKKDDRTGDGSGQRLSIREKAMGAARKARFFFLCTTVFFKKMSQ